jgi:transcriptional regulator with PAS, ATPase and Fis domain
MQKVFDTISRVASAPCNILITGESGTGKDLVAQAIHQNSTRSSEKFVPVNCGSIPEGLLESELFGHTKGSFSGAISETQGLVQSANGGTLFLDEIGDMPLSLQVKILRLIQNKQVQKVGSTQQESVDVRIIAATNQKLKDKIAQKSFRRDLYYRINVVEINLPPLRDRGSDISLLASHFLKHYCAVLNKNIETISPQVITIFQRYPWPGNVRELENAIERAVTFCASSMVRLEDIPTTISDYLYEQSSVTGSLQHRLSNLELKCIKAALEANDHDLGLTANDLHISLATLYRKLKKFNLPMGRKMVDITDSHRVPAGSQKARKV